MYRPPTSVLLAVIAAFATSACTNLSGLGGEAKFKCPVPDGVPCMSMSEVDSSYHAGVLPGQDRPPPAGHAVADREAVPTAIAVPAAVAVPIGAIRTEPTIIRIWIAPWEDADGDLNDQGYVYLQIDAGRWLIEHNRAQIRRTFAPSRPGRPLVGAASPKAGAPQ